MLSVGGVIGAGYFLGAGGAIQAAGPAVIVAYLVGGIVTLLVMALLAEMSVAQPVAGSFQAYARSSLGPMAGFVTGWTYWLAFLLGLASEAIAAATFLHQWFPAVPVWVAAIGVATLMTTVNVVGVLFFGEVEFWLSVIKVMAIAVFAVWGLGAWSAGQVGDQVVSGGFAPNGAAGIFAAMLLVVFGYGGAESIGIAAEESANAERDVPAALVGTVMRIVALYVASIAVLVLVLPWRAAGVSSSPFVDAFKVLGGDGAASVMSLVVLTASLSCIDSGIYATSRMLFALARDGQAPAIFARVHPRTRTPVSAIAASCLVLFAGAGLFIAWPDFAYRWLATLSGFGFLFSWLMIALSQPAMRRRFDATMKWRVPFHPWTQRLAVALMASILASQALSQGGRDTLLAGGAWLATVAVCWWTAARK